MRRMLTLISLSVYALASGAGEIELVSFQAYIPHAYFSPYHDGLDHPASMALNSEKEWQSLWNRVEPRMSHDAAQRTPHSLPKVDFKRYTLLVIAIGSRPSGGFHAVFDTVRESPSEIRVTALERTPGAGCIVTTTVTHPIAYALIPRTAKPVRFDIRKATVPC